MAWLLIQSQVAYQDANGAPLSLGFLYVYDAGTSNPKATYPTSALTPGSENTNPLQADAAGRFAEAYIADGSTFKIVIKDSTLAQTVFSRDNLKAPDALSALTTTRAYRTVNVDTIMVSGDSGTAIGIDASGADRTFTLLSSISGNNGKWINLSKISSAGIVTIQPSGGGTIDGASTLVLDTQYEDVELVCQGASGWHVVSQTAAEPRGELPGVNAQTGTTYQFVIGDKGYKITMSNAAANAVTIPSNATVPFPLNSRIEVSQIGAGQTSLVAGGGVTIQSINSWLKLAGQYVGVICTKTGTNTWLVEGSLTS
jgi:hypothetical protein